MSALVLSLSPSPLTVSETKGRSRRRAHHLRKGIRVGRVTAPTSLPMPNEGISSCLKQADFGTFGRFEETSVGDMPADMKEAYDFTMKLRGLVPGAHRIWLANPELSKTVAPIGAYYQTRSTLTKPEIEIATNLVNGRWSAAYSNYEHEIIGEKAGGLPPEKVEAMIAGRPTSFDDSRQQVVYELASALVAARVVPKGLYQRAKALLGDAGIVDVTMLLGWFTGVSLTLMAFDVPSNAIGLKQ